jgi:hypothetical protein
VLPSTGKWYTRSFLFETVGICRWSRGALPPKNPFGGGLRGRNLDQFHLVLQGSTRSFTTILNETHKRTMRAQGRHRSSTGVAAPVHPHSVLAARRNRVVVTDVIVVIGTVFV